MADQSDVANALVALTTAALYPDGPGSPSVPGPDCKIYRGWPNSAALDADLAAGRINVTIFPVAEPGRNTTRYIQQWQGTSVQSPLYASVAGTTVTLSGTVNQGLMVGVIVNGRSYVYCTTATDTPEIIAANLGADIRTDCLVNTSGSELTFPGASSVIARVVAEAAAIQEVRRQEQEFRVTVWCPDPVSRDASAAAIDLSLAGCSFIALQDGTQARVRYLGSLVLDQSQDALLYRRDLLYGVEYPTTLTALLPTMLFGNLTLNAQTLTA